MSLEAPAPRLKDVASEAQDRAAFVMMLRARGIQDVNLLRAVETVPREIFVPHRFADLAGRAIALPLRCGQTLPEPWLTARMIEALAVSPHHRVLEIGTGSGYATALLARLAREVLSIERFQSLAIEAEERLARLAITNAAVAFGDGLAISPQLGPFNRIIVQGLLAEVPENLIAALGADGLIVAARPDSRTGFGQQISVITRGEDGGIGENPVCPCRMQALLPGEALAL
ncbi:MAG: protein-L-isoaspartate(D-aspartate) O-methyltransferase [Beijerinckiaceae bacterium]|nr:protein-L-isoaspartate(D-aspartate) O-methyltransferase [Beijerinckiaceae bacterium]MCI0734926.1 protein-L-isoaspartate(D-aspartate) O-methyltransferase [Beijerinckiaceae bacterium]